MRVETHKIHHDKQRELSCYPVVALMRAGIENIRILDKRTDNKLNAYQASAHKFEKYHFLTVSKPNIWFLRFLALVSEEHIPLFSRILLGY